MANAYAHRTTGFSLGGFAHNLAASFKSAHARSNAYRRTYDELSRLSDRELADIGVHRSMIHEIAQAEADRY